MTLFKRGFWEVGLYLDVDWKAAPNWQNRDKKREADFLAIGFWVAVYPTPRYSTYWEIKRILSYLQGATATVQTVKFKAEN